MDDARKDYQEEVHEKACADAGHEHQVGSKDSFLVFVQLHVLVTLEALASAVDTHQGKDVCRPWHQTDHKENVDQDAGGHASTDVLAHHFTLFHVLKLCSAVFDTDDQELSNEGKGNKDGSDLGPACKVWLFFKFCQAIKHVSDIVQFA